MPTPQSLQADNTEIISGKMRLHRILTTVAQQISIAATIKAQNGVLLTEWVAPTKCSNTTTTHWYTLYLLPNVGLYCISSPLSVKRPMIADLSRYFPVSARLQRAIYELTRIPTRGSSDKRWWLNHGYFPLGILNDAVKNKPTQETPYSFKKVSGSGVHEIAVGPVHAGIIEPGHFRFSVVGDRILKLETRLGYTHKGIHHLLQNKTIEEGAKLIGRVSGDSTVGYAYAFAMACEHALGYTVDPYIELLRAILSERERLANHLGDIGAIINDAALPSLQSSFTILKEQLLRRNREYTHHRYAMDTILPFKSNILLDTSSLQQMDSELVQLNGRLFELQGIVDNHAGLQDRLQTTGILTPEYAKKLGVVGLTAKASGIDLDLRRTQGYGPYAELLLVECFTRTGDVAERVNVRFKECFESIVLIKEFITKLTESNPATKATPHHPKTNRLGIGCVESWRGPIVVVVAIDNGQIQWCHFHDPSWQNWQALEYAVMDNIVADFPLINKSFNLSYSGHDS